MRSMVAYTKAAVERAIQLQEVILRVMAKRITWWQAVEIIGNSDRSMRRWRERSEQHGYNGFIDHRRGAPSGKRVPLAQVEQVLGLYRERYFDLKMRHFHEKLDTEHGIGGDGVLEIESRSGRRIEVRRGFDGRGGLEHSSSARSFQTPVGRALATCQELCCCKSRGPLPHIAASLLLSV